MSSTFFIEPTIKDKFLSVFFVVLMSAIIIVSGFFVLENYGFLLWLMIVIISIGSLVLWHSVTRGFRCSNCGHEFMISFWQDLPTANSIPFMKKMLKCPGCQHKDYAIELVVKRT